MNNQSIRAIRSRDQALEISEPLFSKNNRLIEKMLEENNHLTRQ
jgi:hypothetical protein